MQNKLLPICMMLFVQSFLFGQNTVTGTITDANGVTLPFATIVVEGTTIGTNSDLDGKYELTFTGDENTVIVFSFTGFASQKIRYAKQPVIDVVLQEAPELLEQVVVVGYGTQKKSDVTGSVATIEVEDAKVVPTTNVAEMLRGKSAGVQVTLDDPSPGGGSKILIRGKNSFQGGNDPLFILDGVPTADINSINIEDVKSIEVLKDASAQAIYGARASNGVILISTKRGQSKKLKISYHGYRSEQQLVRNFDLYNGEEWAQLRREAYRSENNDEYQPDDFVFTPLQLEVLESGKFVDWEDEVINNASKQNHSLSLSAGTENSSIYASFSYFDQKGIIPGSAYKRGTARVNLDHRVNDKFSFGTNIYLTTDKRDFRSGSLNFITLPPLARVRDENGELIRFPTGEETTTSPLWNIRESTDEFFTNQFQFTLFAEYKIFKNFRYKLN
ncbi:MAG TPA: SusC/RagA family TonB-linked outer membrane protein, partial [Bacteroidetes bacterium]|nr:SusC/RagA family TonB-linked outer membrane protein [Bacteroidota bacterium]